ncbi:MAG: dihydroorotate dehydrogenase [Chloroflexi bacterium]|nr:dihydroorotate dehydrogenase [Chloroflexota bacterium]
MPKPDMSVNIAPGHESGLLLRAPVMIACGTFGQDGYGDGMPPGSDWQTLGAVVAKTATVRERLGNPRPRIAHGRAWTMNSIGLANPGIDTVLRDYAPKWTAWQVPVILSIAGESVDDFHALASAVDGTPGVAAIEINVSCPNVAGGLDFAQSPELTAGVVRAVVGATSLPVIAKLSPNVADIVPIAQAAETAGAHALTLTNTLIGMALDRDTGGSVLGAVTGGVSGPALKPITLAMVYRTYRAVGIPIIGVGGIESTDDALDYLHAGAAAVQVGTANFTNPRAPVEVQSGLERRLARRRLASVSALTGLAHRDAPSPAQAPVQA